MLVIMLGIGIILMRIFGQYIDNTYFWFATLGVPVLLWSAVASVRLLVWMLLNIRANGFDSERERWILDETRRTRRALEILSATFICGYPQQSQAAVVEAMLSQRGIITSRSDEEGGNDGVRMTCIDREPHQSITSVIQQLFSQLIESLPVQLFSQNTPLVILFDVSSSVPVSEICQIWQETCREAGVNQPVEFAEGSGPGFIDNWLDRRIMDKALLLVIGLQIAPRNRNNSAEAAVALLLGNRRTQTSLPVLALLHRPDPARGDDYETSLKIAAYNVPVQGNVIQHLWLAGMTPKQYTDVVIHQTKHPLQAVTDETVMMLDSMMGSGGAAAPWLAIAAATQAARQTQSPQMVISGDIAQDVLWSTIIAPAASRQENDA